MNRQPVKQGIILLQQNLQKNHSKISYGLIRTATTRVPMHNFRSRIIDKILIMHTSNFISIITIYCCIYPGHITVGMSTLCQNNFGIIGGKKNKE